MCDGNSFALDRGLLLGGESRCRRGIGTAVDVNGETARGDPRRHLEFDLERRAADLLEPEPMLLDEIERQPVCTRRPRRGDGKLELDLLSGSDGAR